MRRHAFGFFALLFLVAGVYLAWYAEIGPAQWLHASALRIGMVLGAVWLAYPELSRIPRWLYVVILAAITVVMIRPILIVFVAPAVIAIWVLRPREQRKSS